MLGNGKYLYYTFFYSKIVYWVSIWLSRIPLLACVTVCWNLSLMKNFSFQNDLLCLKFFNCKCINLYYWRQLLYERISQFLPFDMNYETSFPLEEICYIIWLQMLALYIFCRVQSITSTTLVFVTPDNLTNFLNLSKLVQTCLEVLSELFLLVWNCSNLPKIVQACFRLFQFVWNWSIWYKPVQFGLGLVKLIASILKVSYFRKQTNQAEDSPKKQTKTRRTVVKTNSFVRFLGESSAWLFLFEINWPLAVTRLKRIHHDWCSKLFSCFKGQTFLAVKCLKFPTFYDIFIFVLLSIFSI